MIETKNPSIRDANGRLFHAADGPWNREPDRVEFESSGLTCLLRRVNHGAWCGYVAVPPGHPLHGVGLRKIDLDVHGGVTHADSCDEELGVCHVPKPGDSDDVWWLGFDAGHAGDLIPGHIHPLAYGWSGDAEDVGSTYGEYRDLEYMLAETRRLAAQVAG